MTRSTRSFSSCRPSWRIFSRKLLASLGFAASMWLSCSSSPPRSILRYFSCRIPASSSSLRSLRTASSWLIVRSSTRSRTNSRTRSPRSVPRSFHRPETQASVMAVRACSAWCTGCWAEISHSRSRVGAVSRSAMSVTTRTATRCGSSTVQWMSTSALKNVAPPDAGSSIRSVVTNVPVAISQMVCGLASGGLS
ncbi:hypothetical protein RB201_18605 [Streptomyces sp. S1A(2023)]